MDCTKCGRTDPQAVPYLAYESALARYDRANRRSFIVILALIVALAASWVTFAVYESQFEYVSDVVTEQEIAQETDGGNNTVIGGSVYGATDD